MGRQQEAETAEECRWCTQPREPTAERRQSAEECRADAHSLTIVANATYTVPPVEFGVALFFRTEEATKGPPAANAVARALVGMRFLEDGL